MSFLETGLELMFGSILKGWFGEKATQFGMWCWLDSGVYHRFHGVIDPSDARRDRKRAVDCDRTASRSDYAKAHGRGGGAVSWGRRLPTRNGPEGTLRPCVPIRLKTPPRAS